MSITMNQALCKGCKACEQVCPGSLIKMNEAGKAYIKYPKDCWGCSSCVKECHFGAISLYLGADSPKQAVLRLHARHTKRKFLQFRAKVQLDRKSTRLNSSHSTSSRMPSSA